MRLEVNAYAPKFGDVRWYKIADIAVDNFGLLCGQKCPEEEKGMGTKMAGNKCGAPKPKGKAAPKPMKPKGKK